MDEHDAVELEIQQFPDTHSGRSEQTDADASEAIVEPGDCGHHVPVDIGGQGPGHGFGHAGDVAEEDESSLRCGGPSPFGDVFEEHA
ncbi:MAG: hypothetical protein WA797_08520 [Acidimicrobiales bacterium]